MADDAGMNSKEAPGAATTQQATDSASSLSITLDIAEILSAVLWPLLIVIILLALRRNFPSLLNVLPTIFDRVQKISLGNFSLELAKATSIAPQWTPTDSALDIRKSMSSAEVTDSTAWHFTNQLTDTTPADFALVDLGEGREWLSSRLFIISVLLQRSKDTRAFVFVRTAGKRRRKLIGWAEPEAIRWSLAQRFPWLEAAYARSYAEILPPDGVQAVPRMGVQVISHTGMLGTAGQGASPQVLIQLMQTFLREIQSPAPPIQEEEEQWVQLQAAAPTWEHACWLTSDGIEDTLGDELFKQFVSSAELDGKTGPEQARRLLQPKQRYVPIVDDGERFTELIDRQVLLERIGIEVAKA